MVIDGGSPVLGIPCPVCAAPVGAYCTKPDGSKQVIAHKKRRDAYWKPRATTGGAK